MATSGSGDDDQVGVAEEVVGGNSEFRAKSNVVTLVVLVGTWWLWHFARRVNGLGLDLAVREPSTLGFIMGMMYILSWAWLEFSISFCEYDPYTRAFEYCSSEAFLALLVGSAIVFCVIMWGMCKKASDKYSDYRKMMHREEERQRNPYSEREGKVKPGAGCNKFFEVVLCNVTGPRDSLRRNFCCCMPDILAEQLLNPSLISFCILLIIAYSLLSAPPEETDY